MKRPQFRERFLNQDVVLPLNLQPEDFRNAIERVYNRYHFLNESYIRQYNARFNKAFRGNNAIGDFIGHQFNVSLIKQHENLEQNPYDDKRPDIIHSAFREAANDRDSPLVDGIEQKAAQYHDFFTSHNPCHTNVLFLQYRVKRPDSIKPDAEPFEFTQILIADASAGGDDFWKYETRGKNSNTTYRAAEGLRDVLRTNPIYQIPDAIWKNEKEEKYRRVQASFDPVFAEKEGYPQDLNQETLEEGDWVS